MDKYCQTMQDNLLGKPAKNFGDIPNIRNNEVTVADLLSSARSSKYDGRLTEEDQRLWYFEEHGYTRDDVNAEADLHTFTVNRLFRDMYNLEGLPTCKHELLQPGVYEFFEHITEEAYQKVLNSVNMLKRSRHGFYEVIAYHYGFLEGTYYSLEQISEKINLKLEIVQEIKESALQQLRDNDGYKMPRIIGVVL